MPGLTDMHVPKLNVFHISKVKDKYRLLSTNFDAEYDENANATKTVRHSLACKRE